MCDKDKGRPKPTSSTIVEGTCALTAWDILLVMVALTVIIGVLLLGLGIISFPPEVTRCIGQ